MAHWLTHRLLIPKYLPHIKETPLNLRYRPPAISDRRATVDPVSLDLQFNIIVVCGVLEFDGTPIANKLEVAFDVEIVAFGGLGVE